MSSHWQIHHTRCFLTHPRPACTVCGQFGHGVWNTATHTDVECWWCCGCGVQNCLRCGIFLSRLVLAKLNVLSLSATGLLYSLSKMTFLCYSVRFCPIRSKMDFCSLASRVLIMGLRLREQTNALGECLISMFCAERENVFDVCGGLSTNQENSHPIESGVVFRDWYIAKTLHTVRGFSTLHCEKQRLGVYRYVCAVRWGLNLSLWNLIRVKSHRCRAFQHPKFCVGDIFNSAFIEQTNVFVHVIPKVYGKRLGIIEHSQRSTCVRKKSREQRSDCYRN